jgi:CheY-like chemotaxis protein
MRRTPGIALLVLALAALVPAAAQQGKEPPKKGGKPDEGVPDYREFFTKPKTAAEYWKAMQFEMEVGRYDLAAGLLHGLLTTKPTDDDLVNLEEQNGMAAFLKLRNVPRWSDNPKVDAQARKDVDALIDRVSAAVRTRRGDPKRIREFIGNLLESSEEHDYALKELYKSGAEAVPYLIAAIQKANPRDRVTLLDALTRLGPDTVDPIRAALDANDPLLVLELIDVLRKRAAVDSVPDLWYPSASPAEPEDVRRKATRTLAYFLGTKADRLPPAKAALVAEAERYYNHAVKFPDPRAVTIWRWDGKGLVRGLPGAETVPASVAEEYYGRKYAGQALALDPAYGPAQVVWLSLALDKAQGQAGLATPLERAVPGAQDMLSSVSVDLVNAVLDRALREGRVPVILATVRDLGARASVRATHPSSVPLPPELEALQPQPGGPRPVRPPMASLPPLVRALYYPDPRVQVAAAEALTRIPGPPAVHVPARLVEVLRRTLAADPGAPTAVKPRVLVGYFNDDERTRVAQAVAAAGFDPVPVATGRVLLLRLAQAADIDLILMDEALPDPGLAHLLANLRADVNVGLVPVVVTAPPDRAEPLSRFLARQDNVDVEPSAILDDRDALRRRLQAMLGDPARPAVSPPERKELAERSVALLSRLARGEPRGYDVRPAEAVVLDALKPPPRLRPEGQVAAADVASRLAGPEPQRVLADVVLDGKRPLAVRVAAAADLVRHIQAFGLMLRPAQAQALIALHDAPETDKLPQLKSQLALVVGSLHRDPRLSAEHLLQYQPAPRK